MSHNYSMTYKIYYTSKAQYVWILENFGIHEMLFRLVKYDYFSSSEEIISYCKESIYSEKSKYCSIKWFLYYQLIENI